MFVVRLGSFAFKMGLDRSDATDSDIISALDLIEGKMMSNFDQLQGVLTDLTTAIDAQGTVVDGVDQKLNELEAAKKDGQDVTPLIAQLRTQVDELKGNTEKLSNATTEVASAVSPDPAPADPAPVTADPAAVADPTAGVPVASQPVTDASGNIVDPATVGGDAGPVAGEITDTPAP